MKTLASAIAAFLLASSAALGQQAPLQCDDPSITTATKPQNMISVQDSYPILSTVLGEEGASDLTLVVESNGTVDRVQVLHSSGFPRLDDAAVNAVKQSLYSPAKVGDGAVSCVKRLRIVWKLEGQNNTASNLALVLTAPRSLYPPAALAKHDEGVADVEVFVGTDGKIVDAHVIHSSDDELNDASIAYVKTFTMKPGSIGGNPAPTVVAVRIIWRLDTAK